MSSWSIRLFGRVPKDPGAIRSGPYLLSVGVGAVMLRAMKLRRFGRLGWDVGEIGCGMWGAVAWSGGDRDEVRAALQLAVDRGCTFFDTALAYGAGSSEELLGDLVRANPDRRLYTATKIPPPASNCVMKHPPPRGRRSLRGQHSWSKLCLRGEIKSGARRRC